MVATAKLVGEIDSISLNNRSNIRSTLISAAASGCQANREVSVIVFQSRLKAKLDTEPPARRLVIKYLVRQNGKPDTRGSDQPDHERGQHIHRN